MIPRLQPMRSLLVAAALTAAAFVPSHGQQSYPNRPIRILVGFQAGSSSDVAARGIAQKLSDILKNPVVVENRPGASSDVAAKAVAAAAPDGYTLYVATVANTINTAAKGAAATDVTTALMPIAQIGEVPNILVVNPEVPATTVADIIRLAKEKPGKLAYASTGSGSALHMAAELFSTMAGVSLLHVPYQGSAAAMPDLLTGRISIMFAPASTVTSFLQSGKLRAIASATGKRATGMPDLPTVSEQGLPGFEIFDMVRNYGARGITGPDCPQARRIDPAGRNIAGFNRAVQAAGDRRDPARPGRIHRLCEGGKHEMVKGDCRARTETELGRDIREMGCSRTASSKTRPQRMSEMGH